MSVSSPQIEYLSVVAAVDLSKVMHWAMDGAYAVVTLWNGPTSRWDLAAFEAGMQAYVDSQITQFTPYLLVQGTPVTVQGTELTINGAGAPDVYVLVRGTQLTVQGALVGVKSSGTTESTALVFNQTVNLMGQSVMIFGN